MMIDARPTQEWADARCRVTKWEFPPRSHTGMHRHEYDYVVVPITGGDFVAVGQDGSRAALSQVAGEAYARGAGVTHDVVNESDAVQSFVECEFLGAVVTDVD